jgi:hypothetical protein
MISTSSTVQKNRSPIQTRSAIREKFINSPRGINKADPQTKSQIKKSQNLKPKNLKKSSLDLAEAFNQSISNDNQNLLNLINNNQRPNSPYSQKNDLVTIINLSQNLENYIYSNQQQHREEDQNQPQELQQEPAYDIAGLKVPLSDLKELEDMDDASDGEFSGYDLNENDFQYEPINLTDLMGMGPDQLKTAPLAHEDDFSEDYDEEDALPRIDEPLARKPRGKTSWVWKYFDLSNNGSEAICRLCGEFLKYFNSTSALGTHLKSIIIYN